MGVPRSVAILIPSFFSPSSSLPKRAMTLPCTGHWNGPAELVASDSFVAGGAASALVGAALLDFVAALAAIVLSAVAASFFADFSTVAVAISAEASSASAESNVMSFDFG